MGAPQAIPAQPQEAGLVCRRRGVAGGPRGAPDVRTMLACSSCVTACRCFMDNARLAALLSRRKAMWQPPAKAGARSVTPTGGGGSDDDTHSVLHTSARALSIHSD
jgi:hypothetical protein